MFTKRGVSLRLPLRRTVGLNKADDRRSGQGLRGKDSPLQLDPETCERIAPQDDLARFHVKNLPARAHRAGRQRHCGHKRIGSGRNISREVGEEKKSGGGGWWEKGQISLGDVTGNRMSHAPPRPQPSGPRLPPPDPGFYVSGVSRHRRRTNLFAQRGG